MNVVEEWLKGCPDFFAEIAGERSHFFSATSARAQSAKALAPSWRVDDLLKDYPEDVMAWMHGPDRALKTALVPPAAARSMYATGITLHLEDVRFLEPLAKSAAAAFDIPQTFIKCSMFCNMPGAITRPHFDNVDTFTVQVTGSKRWRVARNDHVPYPTANWVWPEPVSHDLRLYAHDELPAGMPGSPEWIQLDPGAMLYVPSGWWHETVSDEESVSLHIHVESYSWAAALSRTLQAKLLRDQSLRKNMLWELKRRDRRRAEGAIAAMCAGAGGMSADDLEEPVPNSIDFETPVISRARSSFGVVRAANGVPAQVAFTSDEHGTERVTNIEMSSEFLAAALLVARSREPRSASQLASSVPGLTRNEALALVRLMVDVGYVRTA